VKTAAILAGIVGREFKRVLRSRARLASTFARPLIWLVIIGSGFSALIPGGNFSYHKYLLPGIIGMVVLFSSLLSALGSVQDREFGSMRMLMISPVPRGLIVLGKALAATLLALAFAVVLTPLAWVFSIEFGFDDWLRFLGATLLCAMALSSLGMLVAARIRRLENFAVAMNFVIFPMFFLSGALYPTEKLAAWLQPLVRINPLTYGVDLMRHTLLAQEYRHVSHVEFQPIFDIAYLLVFSVVALSLAARLFGGEEHLAPMFLGGAARKKPTPKQVGVGRLRLPAPAGPLSAIVGREFKRAARQRGRLASTVARPLLWLIAAGTGFEALIPGGNYETYLLPGIIGMVILFSCLLSALGSVHDRQFGPMRMLLIAPVPRGKVVFGKTISSTLLGTAFAIVFSILVPIFGIEVSFANYLGFVGSALLCALALSSLGMLAASRIRKLEDFAVAMNFVIFPLFFFSGALYPAGELPSWMQPLVRLNPLTYGVDLMRQTLLASENRVLAPAQFHARLDIACLVAFTIVCFSLAAKFFGREEHVATMMLGSAPKRLRSLPRRSASGTGGRKPTPIGT
jgi:ABC-2 type transport system permease protein